jgi:hypothetical protein
LPYTNYKINTSIIQITPKLLAMDLKRVSERTPQPVPAMFPNRVLC